MDTEKYDQQAKTDREREERSRKYRENKAAQVTSGDTPLFQDDAEVNPGVHVVDTEAGDSQSANVGFEMDTGGHDVDTRGHQVDTGVHLASSLYKEKESCKEKEVTPLPPAERGESGPEPNDEAASLPVPGLAAGDPGFEASLGLAAAWVMRQLGITKRRLEPVIAAQMRQFGQQYRGETLDRIAERMAHQGRQMHEDRLLLRHAPWGWPKFFSEGHWARPLPYDAPTMREQRQMRDAAIGAQQVDRRSAEQLAADESKTTEATRRYLEALATTVSQMIGSPERDQVAGGLRVLARDIPADPEVLEQSLADLERTMLRSLERSTSGSQLRIWREEAERGLRGKHLSSTQVHRKVPVTALP